MQSIRNDYLKSAIEKLYGREEDFIVIGLTGRTGSGCSTVAKILCQEKPKHSLDTGARDLTNERRKQRIVGNWVKYNWKPFALIQARSVITLLMAADTSAFEAFASESIDDDAELIKNIAVKLSKLHRDHSQHAEFAETLTDSRRDSGNTAQEEDPSIQAAVDFYTKTLPAAAEEIRNELGETHFVKLYQRAGKNIRLSGDPHNGTQQNGKFFTLAETINSIIKIIRRCKRSQGREAFIVVDAIRNPLEAIYFQDRYAAFYLMAVSAPDQERVARLRNLNFTEKDITELDNSEYKPHDLDETEFFSVQDIQGCLQRADLYVSNPNAKSSAEQFNLLSSQVLRFITLIRRPGIVTPTHVERCMQVAYTAKLNSGCISRQVGAVVTGPDFSIRSLGWNDVALGQVPCNLRSRSDLAEGLDASAYSDYELSQPFKLHMEKSNSDFSDLTQCGRHTPFCFKSEYNTLKGEKNQVHTRSLHAEENAFLQAARHHSATLEGGFLFTTAAPCELCSKKAYQLGMKTIYYIDPYPGIAVDQILRSGLNRPKLELFSGAIGKAFHRLYTPMVPLKDELNALTK